MINLKQGHHSRLVGWDDILFFKNNILSSCQRVYVIKTGTRAVGANRMTPRYKLLLSKVRVQRSN